MCKSCCSSQSIRKNQNGFAWFSPNCFCFAESSLYYAKFNSADCCGYSVRQFYCLKSQTIAWKMMKYYAWPWCRNTVHFCQIIAFVLHVAEALTNFDSMTLCTLAIFRQLARQSGLPNTCLSLLLFSVCDGSLLWITLSIVFHLQTSAFRFSYSKKTQIDAWVCY